MVVGAKRPHNLDYKLEETYVMIESTENGEVNNPSSFKTKDENLDKVLNTETNNLKLSEPITEYDIKIMEKAPKIIKEENKEEEDNNDEEIEKNLNRILEEEEDDLNKIIKNNLKMKKKQIKNKKDEINIENNTEGEDKNEKINTEKIFDLEIFNWKKKKLF